MTTPCAPPGFRTHASCGATSVACSMQELVGRDEQAVALLRIARGEPRVLRRRGSIVREPRPSGKRPRASDERVVMEGRQRKLLRTAAARGRGRRRGKHAPGTKRVGAEVQR